MIAGGDHAAARVAALRERRGLAAAAFDHSGCSPLIVFDRGQHPR